MDLKTIDDVKAKMQEGLLNITDEEWLEMGNFVDSLSKSEQRKFYSTRQGYMFNMSVGILRRRK